MMKRVLLTAGLVAGALGVGACGSAKPPVSPREIKAESRSNFEALREAMIRKALKADMALAEVHFQPHSGKLSNLGEHRLQQYAEILTTDGGTLHVEGASPDSELSKQRIDSAIAYLSAAGVARERIAVEPGLREGRGMSAKEAIQVRELQFDPNTQQLTTLIGGGTGGGMGSQ